MGILGDARMGLRIAREIVDVHQRLMTTVRAQPYVDEAQRCNARRAVFIDVAPGALRISCTVNLNRWDSPAVWTASRDWEYGLLGILSDHLVRMGYSPVDVRSGWRTVAVDVRPRCL